MRRSNFGDFGDFESMFERMAREFEEMNRRLEESFGSASASAPRRPSLPVISNMTGMGSMSVDVADYDDELVITADVPGFEKGDIDVSIAERTLTISAEREFEEEEQSEEGEYLRRERSQTTMRRSIPLPVDVDESGASATYTNGVLSVTLPKASHEEDSHHIDVN